MKEYFIRILVASAIFAVSVIPFLRGVYYPPMLMVMIGFGSAILGNIITDKFYK